MPRLTPFIALLMGSWLASASAELDTSQWPSDVSTAWPAGSGQARIELRGDYLPGHGVELIERAAVRNERLTSSAEVGAERLWLFAPFGNFEDFSGGRLELVTDLTLRHGGREVSLQNLVLVPAEQHRVPTLQIHDPAGHHLANLTHMHIVIHPDRGTVTLDNGNISATATLAERLGQPDLAGMPIGQAWLELAIDIPPGADVSGQGIDLSGRGMTCDDRPYWPQDGHELDVELIAIGSVAGGGFEPESGQLKITPSATLKNAGEADVPWFRQFQPASPSLYPHEPRDQHPFLVWNAYRIMDGRIEQLAASGTKHAFLTINVNCDLNCGNSNILWPGCEDTYGVGNNDTTTYQGPRDEIEASQGLWDSCESFFDPECNDSQSGYAGDWLNRLLVEPEELDHAAAEYFLDSWYVIQYDVDIWNTMGYHSINPSQGGSGGYTFNPLGEFTQGPPLSEWVPEGRGDPMEAHQVIEVPSLTPDEPYPYNMPQGHLRVLARVHELDNGLYRYNYAVMNYDFDRGVRSFSIPLAEGVNVSETWMGGPPDVLTSPWDQRVTPNAVVFSALDGEHLPWFTLYNFEVVTDTAPVSGGVVGFRASGSEEPRAIQVSMPAPGSELPIFQDRFRAPNS